MPSPSPTPSAISLLSPKTLLPMDYRVVSLFLVLHILSLLSQGEAQFGVPPFGPPPYDGWGQGRNFMPKNINCSDIVCGRGSCNSSYISDKNGSYSYSYSYSFSANGSLCGCRSGWGAAFSNGDFWYRPCVIPNCTTNSNCDYTLPKVPTTPPKNATDPCAWAYCGAGKCVATSEYKYRCNCKDGFKNLFNDTAFPCYNECLIDNEECKAVGATFANVTTESPGGNKGDTAIPGILWGLMTVLICLALT